jgi:hypothetical protein
VADSVVRRLPLYLITYGAALASSGLGHDHPPSRIDDENISGTEVLEKTR